MALVTNVTKMVEIPGEEDSAVIRKLSHKQLKEAAKARQSEGVGFMREMGGELLKALRDDDRDKLKQMQETQEAMIDSYDRDTLLRKGIVSWTYPIPPVYERDQAGNAVPMNGKKIEPPDEKLVDGVDQLDEPAAKFLAEQIFEFSRPQTKAESKKDSGVSISI